MKTIAILNQKGGVGKTTTAVTLAHGLALAQFRTLLVDLDPQGNVSDALGLTKSDGLCQLLVNEAGLECVTPSGREYLDVLQSNKRTVEAKQVLAGQSFRETAVQRGLARIFDQASAAGDGYDVCILDTAPGADLLQIGALIAADAFLIPVNLSHLAVVGASDALATAASLKQVAGLSGEFWGALPTMWDRVTKESHYQLEALAAQFGELIWPPIPQDTKLREAPAHGQTIWEYAPHTRGVFGVDNGDYSEKTGGYMQVLDRLVREL